MITNVMTETIRTGSTAEKIIDLRTEKIIDLKTEKIIDLKTETIITDLKMAG